jgi:hypothetical protein
MGSLYQYACKCGYETQVSGGPDMGFIVKTQTMTCADCNILVDVITGPPLPDMPLDGDLKKTVGKCPNCNGMHVTIWPDTGPCPKCGKNMQQGNLEVLWD